MNLFSSLLTDLKHMVAHGSNRREEISPIFGRDGFFRWKVGTDEIECSARCMEIFGLGNEAATGSPDMIWNHVVSHDIPIMRRKLRAVVSGTETHEYIVTTVCRKDGKNIPVLLRGGFDDPGGDPPFITVHVSDLSEQPIAGTNGQLRTAAGLPGSRLYLASRAKGLELRSWKAEPDERRIHALYNLSQMNDEVPENDIIHFALERAVRLTGSAAGFLSLAPGQGSAVSRFFWEHLVAESKGQSHALYKIASRVCDEALARNEHSSRIVEGPPEYIRAHDPEQLVPRFILVPVMENGRIACLASVGAKATAYTKTDLHQLELFVSGMWLVLRRRWTLHSLIRAKRDAEAASLAKNEFLANISHELRTPLHGILGTLQLLQLSSLDETQREWVESANSSGKGLLRILSDILDFTQMESGSFQLRNDSFSLEQTLYAVADFFRHEAGQKNISLDLVIEKGLPTRLIGDDARIRQILFNIMGNAFKFTEHGAVSITCSALRHSTRERALVYIVVQDTGIGMPEDSLERIFQMFTQLDGSTTRRYTGTGLGLGIVRRLIQLMGGSLCMESEVGQGTSVHITLPLDIPAVQEHNGKIGDGDHDSVETLRILIAEDDPINRMTISGLLQRLGHSAHCVENGKQALEALQNEYFDCIFSDIQMPEMDGLELIRRIRNAAPGTHKDLAAIPAIALTAHAMAGDKDAFLKAGYNYYLSKPLALNALQKALTWVDTELRGSKRGTLWVRQ